ncbi:penicillin-sensitive transpeptidase [Alteromonas australica]|uniref:penicillin-binding protein 1A n=1 Tax=Alteromonas TaxID=226 RepID=UPI0005C40FDA|nr:MULTISPECIES: penicillin-binding protein 1A [Alteromonas]AJP42716.1 penicillin-sensitive transpeptidase [Alteromonas australica]MAO28726.1 penicillin-binding protein 1A [Alteromonas sp.]QPL49673.1 penicillin-binding protein 1A [Alteromonas sp. B31-7]
MKFIKPLLLFVFLSGLLGCAALVGIYFYIKPDLPSVTVLKDVRLQTPMQIYTNDGKLISQYGVKRRIPVKLDEVPEQLIHAILATEDSRFYEHHGIDPIGIARAAVSLLLTGEKKQGASTLTMQLARGFFLTREKTYIRKVKEIFIAWHMEQVLTKEEILELYLNKVELGHRSFGFGAAAQVYYGKPLTELTLAQIATIAGLPKAPSVLNPISGPERSVERRRVVLLRMLDENYITQQEFEEAASMPVTAKKHGAEIEVDAPYLADIIYNEMVEIYGKEEAETGGYQVYATATSDMQLAAQKAVVRNLHDYDERHGYKGPLGYLFNAPEVNEGDDPLPTLNLSFDISDKQTPSDWTEDGFLRVLREVPYIKPLVPAVVTGMSEQSITVFDVNGNTRTIEWAGLDWARRYITDFRQSNEPEVAADITQPGAVIYIREQEGQWRISQLPEVSGAFIALNPKNGAVEAVVGGYSFYQSQFNRATQAKRQVGSNIKPFVYSAAIDSGYTLASIINDAPINQWNAATGVAWRPQNSPAEYDGPIRMRKALGKSKNVVSVRLLRGVGLRNTVDYLTRFGFDADDIPLDETVSLGSSSHTPLEVVRGMAVIANGGYLVNPHFISKVLDENGTELWKANPVWACEACTKGAAPDNMLDENEEADIEALLEAQLNQDVILAEGPQEDKPIAPQVITPQNAFLVAEMMRTAVRANGNWNKKTYWLGTGWRARNILQRTDIAGKTGTTNDSRDTWFSGFHKDIVATAWVGFDNMGRQLGRATRNQNLVNRNPEKFNWIGNALIGTEDGAKAAGPAWIRFMQYALADKPHSPMPVPEKIVRIRIDRTSGKLTRRTDHTTLFEYFLQGTEPKSYVRDDEVIDPAEKNTVTRPEPEEIF